jgi:hypothetical protein
MRALVLASGLLMALAPVGCGSGGGGAIGIPVNSRTQFESEWSTYLKLSGFKSLAVAGNLDGVYVSGFAHGYLLPQLAVDEALERCEQRRADRRIADPCRTYAIGDEIANEPQGTGVSVE